MTHIAIVKNHTSYLPQAEPYRDFLIANGFKVSLLTQEQLNQPLDAVIYFLGGLKPIWRKKNPHHRIEIHEYNSSSTPPLAIVKNRIKSTLNRKPAGRIFLNPTVRNQFHFRDRVPTILRDIGADASFFDMAKKALPLQKREFDLVYSGKMGERKGFGVHIERLAKKGFSLLLVGEPEKEIVHRFRKYPKVKFTGRLSRDELPDAYSNARFGLNYTPDLYPFNIQTSTKTIEYCACGLGVVSNSYLWSRLFFSERKGVYIDLNTLNDPSELDTAYWRTPDVSDLEWNLLLKRTDFDGFIRNLLDQS